MFCYSHAVALTTTRSSHHLPSQASRLPPASIFVLDMPSSFHHDVLVTTPSHTSPVRAAQCSEHSPDVAFHRWLMLDTVDGGHYLTTPNPHAASIVFVPLYGMCKLAQLRASSRGTTPGAHTGGRDDKGGDGAGDAAVNDEWMAWMLQAMRAANRAMGDQLVTTASTASPDVASRARAVVPLVPLLVLPHTFGRCFVDALPTTTAGDESTTSSVLRRRLSRALAHTITLVPPPPTMTSCFHPQLDVLLPFTVSPAAMATRDAANVMPPTPSSGAARDETVTALVLAVFHGDGAAWPPGLDASMWEHDLYQLEQQSQVPSDVGIFSSVGRIRDGHGAIAKYCVVHDGACGVGGALTSLCLLCFLSFFALTTPPCVVMLSRQHPRSTGT